VQQGGQAHQGCKQGWELMTELKGAEDQMSLTILDLDQLLGFGQPASEIQSLLCWGNMGMTGFQGYLTYLIKEGRVKEVML